MENNQTKQAPKKSIFALDSDDELDNESNEIIKIRNTLVTSATLDQLEKENATAVSVISRDAVNDQEIETKLTSTQKTGQLHGEPGMTVDKNEGEPAAIALQDCADKGNTSAESVDIDNDETDNKLTAFQKAKIERNRQRALLLRQARLQAHPYKRTDTVGNSVVIVQNSKLIDTGGGFLIDENDLNEEQSRPVIPTMIKDVYPL